MHRLIRTPIARLFHFLCVREAKPPDEEYFEAGFEAGFSSTERFFARLPDDVRDLRGKSVLDLGCGNGSTCVWTAQQGACRVVGADVQGVEEEQRRLQREYPDLAGVVEFRQISQPGDFGDERFDLVLSKNTFEHVADPDEYVRTMRSAVAPGGKVVIGFSPLWKSPWGGHIGFMTQIPWAHLLFPEDVIMAERRRFRPDEHATRFEEILGGLNRMTLGRFEQVMAASGLEPSFLEVNAGRRARSRVRVWALGAMKLLGQIPGLREYFAFSVHSVWEPASRPERADRKGRFVRSDHAQESATA
jgi:SAM-dependent methyltransferase